MPIPAILGMALGFGGIAANEKYKRDQQDEITGLLGEALYGTPYTEHDLPEDMAGPVGATTYHGGLLGDAATPEAASIFEKFATAAPDYAKRLVADVYSTSLEGPDESAESFFPGAGKNAKLAALGQWHAAEMRRIAQEHPEFGPGELGALSAQFKDELSQWYLNKAETFNDPVTGRPVTHRPDPVPRLLGGDQQTAQAPAQPAVLEEAHPAEEIAGRQPMAPLSPYWKDVYGLNQNQPAYWKRTPDGVWDIGTLPTQQPTEAEAKSSAQAATATDMLNRLQEIADDPDFDFDTKAAAKARAKVGGTGFLEQGMRIVAESMWGDLNDLEAEMLSIEEQLSNQLLAAFRGAQVGPAEQVRFERQLPRWGQNEKVFRQNIKLTLKNLETIERLKDQKRGRTSSTLPDVTIPPPNTNLLGPQPAADSTELPAGFQVVQ